MLHGNHFKDGPVFRWFFLVRWWLVMPPFSPFVVLEKYGIIVGQIYIYIYFIKEKRIHHNITYHPHTGSSTYISKNEEDDDENDNNPHGNLNGIGRSSSTDDDYCAVVRNIRISSPSESLSFRWWWWWYSSKHTSGITTCSPTTTIHSIPHTGHNE